MAGPTSPQVGQYLINCMTYDRFPAHEGAASVAPTGNEDDWSHRAPGPAPAALMNHECLDPFTNVCTSNTVAVRMFDRWLHDLSCLSNDIDTTLYVQPPPDPASDPMQLSDWCRWHHSTSCCPCNDIRRVV